MRPAPDPPGATDAALPPLVRRCAIDKAQSVCYIAPSFGGPLAQLVEQLTLNQRVVGSNPTRPTNRINSLAAPTYSRNIPRHHHGITRLRLSRQSATP